jgi:hypothetical protein
MAESATARTPGFQRADTAPSHQSRSGGGGFMPADSTPPPLFEGRATGDGRALCEINGRILQVSEDGIAKTLYQEAGGVVLPVLADGTFGFELPHPAPGAPEVIRGGQTPRVRKTRGATTVAAEHAQQLLDRLGWPSQASGCDVSAAPAGSRMCAFAWQSNPTTATATATATHAHLCAAALPDHSVALYDLTLREWSPHKLANTQQREVHALAWQPLSATLLAVGCRKGVCLWRLSFSAANGELSGGHMLRLLEAPGHSPAVSLAFHPRGKWLATGSPCHGELLLWECADATSLTALEMRGGGGVGLLRVSACGLLLLSAGTQGGLRVWETCGWTWESYSRFVGPCTAAAWAGPPLLGADAPRTLLFALRGETRLHALRFTRAAAPPRAEYLGCFELAPLGVGPLRSLAWEGGGSRLVVASAPPAAPAEGEPPAKRGPGTPGGGGGGGGGGGTTLTVLSSRTQPSLQLNCVGQIVGDATLCDVGFPSSLPQGALLAASWHDGRVSLLPLHFH